LIYFIDPQNRLYEHPLSIINLNSTNFLGKIPVKLRGDIVDDFNRKGKGAHILLLSLGAGGVGLNLVGANHLFLIDMHWNPQLEKQVCLKCKYYINEGTIC